MGLENSGMSLTPIHHFASLPFMTGLFVNDNNVEDNLAVESQAPPYARLPQSYRNFLPASYYATHTYVPPIKDLYPSVE